MSGSLVLNREAMRVVQRNDKGIVTYRKRYKQGDVVDTSKIESQQVDNLRASGALVPQADYDAERARRNPDAEAPALQTVAAPSHSGEPVSDEQHEESYGTDPEDAVFDGSEAGGGEDEGEGDGDDTPAPDYDGMDYQALRQTAKDRDLDASGSADDLRTRLREADATA